MNYNMKLKDQYYQVNNLVIEQMYKYVVNSNNILDRSNNRLVIIDCRSVYYHSTNNNLKIISQKYINKFHCLCNQCK